MLKVPTLEEMLKAGVHFGHQSSKWHPKMKPFIFTEKGGVHVINLEETQVQLEKALQSVRETVSAGGTVLFVGTKTQAKDIVKAAAISCGSPFIVSRWLGGTLTNSPSVLGLAKKLRKLKEEKESGALSKYTKKEQLNITREIIRLDEVVGGIEKMEKIPDAIFVVDIKTEKTAVLEAQRRGVPVIAICDTNVNPDLVTLPIPANDDASNSIKLIVDLVAAAISDARLK
jgi:small subunit ribosomal protein S2